MSRDKILDRKRDPATKNRLRRMKSEFGQKPKITSFKNNEKYDQMIVQAGIPFVTNCEHHEVSIIGIAHVGYIPGGKLIGLSKMPRIVEYFANPTTYTLQERLTNQIANELDQVLDKPQGVMVVIEALHSCLCYRGVKKPSITITSELRGGFKKNIVSKEEFMEHIRLHRMRRPF